MGQISNFKLLPGSVGPFLQETTGLNWFSEQILFVLYVFYGPMLPRNA